MIPAPKVSKKHTSFISLPYAAVGIETLMEYSGARCVDNSFVNKIQNCDNSLYKFALRGISTYEKNGRVRQNNIHYSDVHRSCCAFFSFDIP